VKEANGGPDTNKLIETEEQATRTHSLCQIYTIYIRLDNQMSYVKEFELQGHLD